MKTLYLDCSMGAAGDMLTAALLELLPDKEAFVERLNALGIPGVTFKREHSYKCGIMGTHMSVTVNGVEEGDEEHNEEPEEGRSRVRVYVSSNTHIYKDHGSYGIRVKSGKVHHHEHEHDHDHGHEHHHEHEHHHSGMADIEEIISGLELPEKVLKDIRAVYSLIAEAESRAHGVPVTQVHFHEVGAMDAVADITAVCLLMNEIAPDEVVASPVHAGSGYVRCAHGVLPVPAPATGYLLTGIPCYSGSIKGELCTPTGAALLKLFVDRFGPMPAMRTQAVGYGMGKKNFERANCLRAVLGETEQIADTDVMLELSCNVDDMTAESIGFAMDRLFEGGASEVYTVPIGMKKSRPGTLLRVICSEDKREKMISLLFAHTTTIGVREYVTRRYVLERSSSTLDTPYGKVGLKTSSGYGVTRQKYEYDDLARIAKELDISLDEARELVKEK